MTGKSDAPMQLPSHGAQVLPSVTVDSYSVEIEDEDGFIGDKASKGAFRDLLEKWRKPLRKLDEDPLGKTPSDKIGKKKLAELLAEGDPEAAGVIHGAVEEFAQQLTAVTTRILRLKEWRDVDCLVIGGGFRGSRIGELVTGRASVLLKASGKAIDLVMISNHPDEAGLVGAAHLLPPWMLQGHDGILAVDIGGTNIRVGVVELNLDKSKELAAARVVKSEVWRHTDDDIKRDAAVKVLVKMLKGLVDWTQKNKMRLAPVVGIACPGVIHTDGSIERGAQNLPGNWESSRFNLPALVCEMMPTMGDHETMVVMHNDAVVQGLSELPNVKDHRHWGVLTIGTGLGNACFTMRKVGSKKGRKS
jgi:predicted NBD/HSP70 family sugar kinase